MAKDKKIIDDQELPVDDVAATATTAAPVADSNNSNDLVAQLALATEQARRAQADYQNLVRRGQAEKIEFIKFANQELVTQLIEPLRNLSLAAQALNDQGLNMVIDQFWAVLNDLGVKQIGPEIVGQEFNVETMEAIDKQGEGTTVLQLLTPGYTLNDRIIQHAKVAVG